MGNFYNNENTYMNSSKSSSESLNRRGFIVGWSGIFIATLSACSAGPKVARILDEKEALEKHIQTYRIRLGELDRNIPRDTKLEPTPELGVYKIVSKHISRITDTPIFVDKHWMVLTRNAVVNIEQGGLIAMVLEANGLKHDDICDIIQEGNIITFQKKLP